MLIIKKCLIAILLLSIAKIGIFASEDSKISNVIIIFADDLGYGDLSSFGHPTFKTPNLDRMASEGARWTHFYSTCPYCAPSRAALLTGRYQFRSGVTRNPSPDAGIDDVGLPESEITIGEAFQEAGYRTACFGKWHLGHRREYFPTKHGFHEYLGILYSNDMRPVQLVENETVVEYPVPQAELTQKYTDRALEFIQRNSNHPFFLYLPHAMPHKPLAASKEFYQKSEAGLYGDVIAELDHSVGQILDRLRKLSIEDKTLVFFTSDNGPWYGGSTGGLRGMKGSTWEGGIRVPMIAWSPNTIPANQTIAYPAQTIDLFTTALSATKTPLPKDRNIDGINLMPTLLGKQRSARNSVFAMAGANLMSVRSGPWKLHVKQPRSRSPLPPNEIWIDKRAPDGVTILAPFEQSHPSEYPGLFDSDRGEAMSLYNIELDPSESNNVAATHPDEVASLLRKFESLNREAIKSTAKPTNKTSTSSTEWLQTRVVTPQGDNTILLPANQATPHGKKIIYEPEPHKQTIGYWTIADDWVEWRFQVKRPGVYRLEVLQGCGKGCGGSTVDIKIGGIKTLTFTVEETGHFQNFITRYIGDIRFDKPGVYTLEVRPKVKAGPAVMDLRSIALRPQR